ncbi:MAG: hypothetical protein JXQ67_02435 [Campylobacterales bacterium]|nr:hypothetical protein [Campylobacterales bacterium]
MKIAVECQSPLLQKSLEIFLSKYLSSAKKCDLLIRDTKCLEDKRCFYIASNEGADLLKPFSKSQLILALEKRYKELYKDTKVAVKERNESWSEEEGFREESLDFSILEKRIDTLTQEYKENILRAIKAFYEN